jgi:hypothetical protein
MREEENHTHTHTHTHTYPQDCSIVGKDLYNYAFSNARALIDKFQHASNVCDSRR